MSISESKSHTAFAAAISDITVRRWLVTGAAGFIGSHIVEQLLRLGQIVTGLDNFSTGSRHNLELIAAAVGPGYSRFTLSEGDICDLATLQSACRDVDAVIHLAALGSVPRSIADPARSHAVNVDGFLNMLLASRDSGVRSVVYASSSSVYGDSKSLPMREGNEGSCLSPYAATKRMNEVIAAAWARSYSMNITGLRFFNVFGARQDPLGAYAAVIPLWISRLKNGEPCTINGDGSNSRDFCYVDNVVLANLLATRMALNSVATTGEHQAFNIAVGEQHTLLSLHQSLSEFVSGRLSKPALPAIFGPNRPGDIPHSYANIDNAKNLLGYMPLVAIREGLERTVNSYFEH